MTDNKSVCICKVGQKLVNNEMKVPNFEKAIIPVIKLEEYLLSFTHAVGHTKADFFAKIGYSKENVELLYEDLKKIIELNEVVKKVKTDFGTKYIVQGTVGSRFNKSVEIVTIWIVDKGYDIPRFITAYPK